MFKPTNKQLEQMAEIQAAGMGLEFAAKFFGCTKDELKAWRMKCVEAARAEYASMMQAPPPKPGVFKSPRTFTAPSLPLRNNRNTLQNGY